MNQSTTSPPEEFFRLLSELLDGVSEPELSELLLKALGSLPPLQRRLLKLRTQNDTTFEEAGKELGMKPAAARAMASRAYKELKKWMEKRMRDRHV